MEQTKKRQEQLLKLGFIRNDDQKSYIHHNSGYVDFYKITDHTESEWYTFIECVKFDLREAKKELETNELYLEGVKSEKNRFKKKLKDKFNHYNSDLQAMKLHKMDKTLNREMILKLEAKIELLKKLNNE